MTTTATTMIMNLGRKSIPVNHRWWPLMSPRRSGGHSRRCWTVAWESPVIARHSLLCHVQSRGERGERERERFCRLEGSAVGFTINMRGLLGFPFSIVNNNVYLFVNPKRFGLKSPLQSFVLWCGHTGHMVNSNQLTPWFQISMFKKQC